LGTAALIEIFRDAVITGLKVSAPVLILTMLIGLIIAIIQAATSINEQTMTFVPKLVVVAVALVLCGGWMLQQLMDFTMRIFELIATQI